MLFVASVRGSEPSEDIATRIKHLNDHFTLSIFNNVSRSLFERHQLMFSFLMAVRILQADGKVDAAEWRYGWGWGRGRGGVGSGGMPTLSR
jgi:dynein heavy chain